ncbi:MAG: peptidyl-prolyl cis-trans isomerase [Acidobacteriota bacterium]
MRRCSAVPAARKAGWLETIAFVSLLASCGSPKSAGPKPDSGTRPPQDNRVMLTVGDASYSVADLNAYVQEAIGGSVEELGTATLSNLLDKFIEEKLLLRAALDCQITVSAPEKEQFIREAAEGTWTEEEKAAILALDSGPLLDKMKVEKYIRQVTGDVTATDQEIRDYYDRNKSEFYLPERVKVSQILTADEQTAVEAWENLRFADEEGFHALARAVSVGPEAAQGGEMGVFQKGQLPAEFEEAIFVMGEAEVSPVVESSYGFHIFRLDKKYAPEWVSFDSAASPIRLKILNLKAESVLARHLADLKNTLDWTFSPENLPFLYQRIR